MRRVNDQIGQGRSVCRDDILILSGRGGRKRDGTDRESERKLALAFLIMISTTMHVVI